VRAMIEVVFDRVAAPWWGRGWPLFYCRGGIGLAADVAGDTTVPLC
jgi:hypothetical protein